MAENRRSLDNSFALHDVMTQTVDGLHHGHIVPQGQYFINRRLQPTDKAGTDTKSPAGTTLNSGGILSSES
jgi:hypothetical protein